MKGDTVTDTTTQAAVDALLFERAGYVRRGLTDRVDQVNTQLKALGHRETPKARQNTPKHDA